MSTSKRLGVILIVGALLLGLSAPAQSMSASFTIYGQIFDTDGTTPAEGVTVIVTNLATGSSVGPIVTGSDGWYLVNLGNLQPDESHSAGDNIQITASKAPCKNATTTVARIAVSPQLVNLVLQADSTLPVISDLSPADGACVTDSTPEICADYSDAAGIDTTSVLIKVDGVTVTGSATVTSGGVCYTPVTSLSEGVHTAQVTVSDLCGNENTMSWTFTVDTTAPVISDLMPADGACVKDSTPEICADYSDAGGIDTASVLIEVDGVAVTGSATVTSGGVCYTPVTSLSEGVHTVRVNVSDLCGYENTMSWTFTVDITPPVILFNEPPTPANNSEVIVKSVNISATVTDSGCGVDITTVALIWNGTAYPMLASGSTYYLEMHNLPNGIYSYYLQANDTGGNTRISTTRIVTVNVTAYSVTLEVMTDYNLISLPVNDPDITNASTLAYKIGANCTEVVKWDTALQQLVSYIIYAPLNNFDLLPGVGYFVNVLGPTTTTFTGDGWASPFNCSLVAGYNIIGIPVNDTSVTDATSLAAKIGGNCAEVVRWDSASQAYVSYIPGVPLNNFPVRSGEGYLANMNNPATVTFAGVPWHD